MAPLTDSGNRLVGASVVGCWTLVLGVSGTVAAIAIGSTAVFFVATLVTGVGFGTAFLGTFRTLAALATPAKRGELISSIYVVAYLAFSVPAVVAGVLVTEVGLHDTAIGYGIVIAALALVAAPATARATRSSLPFAVH